MPQRIGLDVETTLQAHKIKPRAVAVFGIERIGEPLADVKLISGHSSDRADIGRYTLLELEALLRRGVLVASESAAEKTYTQLARPLDSKEVGVGRNHSLGRGLGASGPERGD